MVNKKESRRSRRARVKIPLRYSLDDSMKSMVTIKDAVVETETINVSVLGASVMSPYLLPPGIRLRVEMDRKAFLTDGSSGAGEPIRALGKIVGVRPEKGKIRLSVMFVEINPQDKELIAAYVRRHL
ncbi:MAG: PilZ domain-containing protein [Candidatus Omnitrophica bacterium]|nr:PilZ domain-containing protein [Candidatus Omnitrophota bacterium]